MQYEVTFLVDGQEQIEHVEAPDAAAAVASVQASHGRAQEQFELIQVHLIDGDPSGEPEEASSLAG